MNDANPAPPASDAPAPPREPIKHRLSYPPTQSIPAASPAQEATPPRESPACPTCEKALAGGMHPEFQESFHRGHARAAPTPEASAPEPAERLKAALNEYARVLETAGAGQDAEHARAAIGFALSITEWVAFLATVAALTAERMELQRQLHQQNAGGKTEKSESPTAATPNQPQAPEPTPSESDAPDLPAVWEARKRLLRYLDALTCPCACTPQTSRKEPCACVFGGVENALDDLMLAARLPDEDEP